MRERLNETPMQRTDIGETSLPQKGKVFSIESVIADTLRNKILGGEYQSQLPNRAQLSGTLRCTPVQLQEAFISLQEENLVTVVPRKGTYLNPAGISQYQENK